MHQTCGIHRHDEAQADNVGNCEDRKRDAYVDDSDESQDTSNAVVSKRRQRGARRDKKHEAKAGDGIRTHDIHVGNVVAVGSK